MPKVNLHYVIINGCDGSATVNFYANEKAADLAAEIEDMQEPLDEKGPYAETFEFDDSGRLLNPSMTKAELLAELAEMRGEETEETDAQDEDTSAPAFNTAAGDPDAVYTGTIHYVTRNGGDGSVSARFVSDAECAQLACDIEDEGGEPFNENPHSQTLKFNGRGELLNPDATVEELEAELRERNGEDEDLDADNDDETPAQAFNSAAAANDNDETLDVSGKTVVFTGRLSTMTRKQAESAAIVMGANVTDSVTRNTDILVVGEDAGSKLAKAQALGVTVMTEAEWNKLTKGSSAPKAPGGPKF